MKVGEVVELLATDPGARGDVLAWVKRTNHELLTIQEEAGILKFYVRKNE